MSTKITTCDKCKSKNIKEINSENRKTVKSPLCKIDCVCNDCGFTFTISSWTELGKRKGIRY
jgi:transposase-like protein